MLDIKQLIQFMRDQHDMVISDDQEESLLNDGYYHGFKNYRIVKGNSQPIQFNDYDEFTFLKNFDMNSKTSFYPKVMFIETSLKSRTTEALIQDCGSDVFDVVFDKSVTHYRSYKNGSDGYHREYKKRMNVRGVVNKSLVRDYSTGKRNVVEIFDQDLPVTIQVVFESLSLGEFGDFYSCINLDTRKAVSRSIRLPVNLDSDGRMVWHLIRAIKHLRNAIAHNEPIHDVRFQTEGVSKNVVELLKRETGILGVDFEHIDSYIIMVTYLLRKMNVDKITCNQFVSSFISEIDILRAKLSKSICNRILGTQVGQNLESLKKFIKNS